MWDRSAVNVDAAGGASNRVAGPSFFANQSSGAAPPTDVPKKMLASVPSMCDPIGRRSVPLGIVRSVTGAPPSRETRTRVDPSGAVTA